MHKVRSNYSSCTCRNSENICSSSGGAQEKRKEGIKTGRRNSVWHKNGAFLSFTPRSSLKANVHFRRFFSESHPVLDQTQGSGPVFSLTLRIVSIMTFVLMDSASVGISWEHLQWWCSVLRSWKIFMVSQITFITLVLQVHTVALPFMSDTANCADMLSQNHFLAPNQQCFDFSSSKYYCEAYHILSTPGDALMPACLTALPTALAPWHLNPI